MGPRIPKLNKRGLDYWKRKGKNGKDVMLYFHDDLDGIFSAVICKERLIELGYNIVGYGVINYQDAWEHTTLNPKMINVAVDFANMPKKDREHLIDIYIDHHGEFDESELENFKNSPVIKTPTNSAYEGICRVIGKPIDKLLLYSIDMVDGARYDVYNVKWTDILKFDMNLFKEMSSRKGKVTIQPFESSGVDTIGWGTVAKLTFVGAFNQFIKRSDHKTLIETVANLTDVSVYSIYNVMRKIYPTNNKWLSGYSKGNPKDFVDDGKWRVSTMQKRTRGNFNIPKIHNTQRDFVSITNMMPSGYQIIGNLMFVPSGTWANALRARAILEQDYINGKIPLSKRVDYILLQYGNTLQVCGYKDLDSNDNLPVLRNGTKIDNLGVYMTGLLSNFQKYFGYYEPDTSIGQDEITVSGGHAGIGTISNIVGILENKSILLRGGEVNKYTQRYEGHSYLDLIKNKIINDLSGVNWDIGLRWVNGDQKENQIIRDIINYNKDIKARISSYISRVTIYLMDTHGAEKNIKDQIESELKRMDKNKLHDLHKLSMMDNKVMLSKSIKRINKYGKITP